MKKLFRPLCFAAAVLLCLPLCLTGCGKTPAAPNDADPPQADVSAQPPQSAGTVHTGSNGIDEVLNYASLFGVTQDGIWAFGGWRDDADETRSRSSLLAVTSLQTGETSCRQLMMPQALWTLEEGQSLQQDIADILFDGDVAFVLLEERLVDHEKDYSDEYYTALQTPLQSALSLCEAGPDGVLSRSCTFQPQQLQPLAGGTVHLVYDGAFWGEDGSLWLTVYLEENAAGRYGISYYLLQAAADGSCQGCTKLYDGFCESPQRVSEDMLVYPIFDNLKGEGGLLVVEGLAAGHPTVEKKTVDNLYFGVLQAAAAEDTPLWWNTNGIFAPEDSWKSMTPVLQWADSGLSFVRQTQLLAVYSLGGQEFLLFTNENGLTACRIKAGAANAADGQTVTIAVCQDLHETLQTAVNNYNYTNPAVRIEIVDYSLQAATAKGFDSGWEMLKADILNNSAPDILQLSAGMNPQNMAGKGLFVDLYPYLDADSQLAREDFVPGALAACEYNGTLPTILPSYWLSTAVVRADALDADAATWTVQQFDAVSGNYALPYFPYSRESILLDYLVSSGAFIDFEAGVCQIDTPAFVHLLQQSVNWPAEFTDDSTTDPKPRITDGEILVYKTTFNSFDKLKVFRYLFDGDYAIAGLPSDTGSGSDFYADLQLGITQYCANPDAAWAFVRTLLLPEYQQSIQYAFPLRQDALQKQAQAALQPIGSLAEFGTLPLYIRSTNPQGEALQYWLQGCVQQDVDRLLAAINNTSQLPPYSEPIDLILEEEFAAFYSGMRTAEEAAAIIQNRVQTYLDEQA